MRAVIVTSISMFGLLYGMAKVLPKISGMVGRDGSSDESPILCVLLMIVAIGTQFAALDSAKNDELPINHSMNHENAPIEADVGISLYQQAAKLIPDMLAMASVESVQAFLLLGVYTLPQDTSGLAYTYLGVAIKMAIQNGMHRIYPGVPLDARALQVRTRLWWTIYTLEKYAPAAYPEWTY